MKVLNISREIVTFTLYRTDDMPDGLPKHKRRKFLRTDQVHVSIAPNQMADLTELSGMSDGQLRQHPELMKVLNNPVRRLEILKKVAPVKSEKSEKPMKEVEELTPTELDTFMDEDADDSKVDETKPTSEITESVADPEPEPVADPEPEPVADPDPDPEPVADPEPEPVESKLAKKRRVKRLNKNK